MKVLGTKMTNAMWKREGYLSISNVSENTFKSYTFNTCLKVKEGGFVKWVLYWDDCPFVYVFTVLTTVLSTGYIKVTIIDKELTFVDTIGAYPSKSNTVFGELSNGKFYDKAGIHQKAVQELLSNDFSTKPVQTQHKVLKSKDTKSLSDAELLEKKRMIEEAWGITSKK